MSCSRNDGSLSRMRDLAQRMRDNAHCCAIQADGCLQLLSDLLHKLGENTAKNKESLGIMQDGDYFYRWYKLSFDTDELTLSEKEIICQSWKAMQEDGCLDVVFNAMDMHMHVRDVRFSGVWMITLAILVDCEMSTLVQKRCIGALLQGISITDYEDAAISLHCLAKLGQNSKPNVNEILTRGGIRIVLDAMRDHQRIQGIQSYGIALLRVMMAQQTSASQFIQSDGLGVLLTAMSTHSTHKTLQSLACNALAELSVHGENLPAIFKAQAVPQVLQAMSTFPEEEVLQGNGCVLIRGMIHGMIHGMGLYFTPLEDHSVVDLALAAMHRFKKNRQIQEAGCVCMRFICKDPEMAIYMATKGGVEAMFDVIDFFWADADICIVASLALDNLLCRVIKVDTGMRIDVVCRAMEGHKMNSCLQNNGASCLMRMLFQNPHEFWYGFPASCLRSSKCVLAAISNHKLDVLTLTKSLESASSIALGMMAHNRREARQLFNTNVVDLCFEALTLHKGDEGIERAVFEMFATLVLDASNLDYIIQLGAMKSILDLGGKHPDSGNMLIAFIHGASAHNTQTCQLLARLGAIQQLYKIERVFTMVPPEIKLLENAIENLKKGGADNCAKIEACKRRKAKQHSTVCAVCGKNALQVGREVLLKCACTIAPLYCSTECQHAHWAAHKKECKANRVTK